MLTRSDGVEDTGLKARAKAKDSTRKAKAKTKDFKIVLEDPRGWWLVLEDSNTANPDQRRYSYSKSATDEY